MNWRFETLPAINKRTQTENFIKNELMNYYFYLEKKFECEELVEAYQHEQDDPSVGGSIAKMPDASPNGSSPQARLANNKSEAESKLKEYIRRLEILDGWMNILTESLHDTVKTYVMVYQCNDIEDAADELNLKSNTVNKYTNRAIKRIRKKIKKIC